MGTVYLFPLLSLRVVDIDLLRIPNDGPSSTKPYNVSMRSGLEYANLRDLTEQGCTCTSKLLDFA